MFSLKLSVSLCTLREETDDSVVKCERPNSRMRTPIITLERDSDVCAEISDRSRARTRAF